MENMVFIPPGVSDEFVDRAGMPFEYIIADDVRSLMLPRAENAHKGTYGHSLLVCGSRGMAGAAVLAVGGTLRSGCGLVTAHIPAEERFAVSANYPSALLSLDDAGHFSSLPTDMEKYSSVGVGCGMGTNTESGKALARLLEACAKFDTPVVLDADALNILAKNPELQKLISEDSILTPHDGELRRLVGEWGSAEERIELVADLAARLKCIVVAKGPNTMTCVKGERLAFNSTGNSGMAKGGSGDVLTGFITGLLARGYRPDAAAVAGVFLHGLAGDKARDYYGAEGMNSSDIIDFLAEALVDMQ